MVIIREDIKTGKKDYLSEKEVFVYLKKEYKYYDTAMDIFLTEGHQLLTLQALYKKADKGIDF